MKTVTLNETEITTSIDKILEEQKYWMSITSQERKELGMDKQYPKDMINIYQGELEVLYHLRNLLDD